MRRIIGSLLVAGGILLASAAQAFPLIFDYSGTVTQSDFSDLAVGDVVTGTLTVNSQNLWFDPPGWFTFEWDSTITISKIPAGVGGFPLAGYGRYSEAPLHLTQINIYGDNVGSGIAFDGAGDAATLYFDGTSPNSEFPADLHARVAIAFAARQDTIPEPGTLSLMLGGLAGIAGTVCGRRQGARRRLP
jgi:hypothetical protein